MTETSAFPPNRNESAPIKIDFPAPVSPERTVKPELNSIFTESIIAKFTNN